MDYRTTWWRKGWEVGRRQRRAPAAALITLGVALGVGAAVLVVTPLVVNARVAAVQAAWDADVAAWSAQCDRAYQQGKADAERLQALAREVAP